MFKQFSFHQSGYRDFPLEHCTYLTKNEMHYVLEFRVTLILLSNNFKLTPFTYKVCIHTPSVLLKVFIIGRQFYTKKAGLKKIYTLSNKNKETLQKSFKVAYSIELIFLFKQTSVCHLTISNFITLNNIWQLTVCERLNELNVVTKKRSLKVMFFSLGPSCNLCKMATTFHGALNSFPRNRKPTFFCFCPFYILQVPSHLSKGLQIPIKLCKLSSARTSACTRLARALSPRTCPRVATFCTLQIST